MSNVKISELPTGTPNLDSIVPVTNTSTSTTEKLSIQQILSLSAPTVVSLTYDTIINTDASLGEIFDVLLTGNTTLANPTNAVNGKTLRWRITQDATGGRSIALDNKFTIPSSATSPLPFSTAPNKTDILAATYHAGRDLWDVVAVVPGY